MWRQGAALESTSGGGGTCAIVGWTEADAVEAVSVSAESILMGRTLKGTYFGGEFQKQVCLFMQNKNKNLAKTLEFRSAAAFLGLSDLCLVSMVKMPIASLPQPHVTRKK